jgi:ADP-ribose pyrophosphatase
MEKIVPENAVLIPVDATCAFEGIIYDVYQWQQEMYDGSRRTFEMLKRADTATAICIVDEEILVIEDRQPNRQPRVGFPGGRVEKSDANVAAAICREITEETGYTFANHKLIQVHQPFSKIEWFVHLYVAWGVAGKKAPCLDPGEQISVQAYSFQEVTDMVLQGVGYLGESAGIFEHARSAQEIIAYPSFQGKTIIT